MKAKGMGWRVPPEILQQFESRPRRTQRYEKKSLFADIKIHAKRKKMRTPTEISAAEARTPGLAHNVFARLLAARTKQDVHTRLVAPKTMWNKFGAVGLEFKPIGWGQRTAGPRGYQSAMLGEMSKGFGHVLHKKPSYAKYKPVGSVGANLEAMEAEQLQQLQAAYEPEGEVLNPITTFEGNPLTVGKDMSGVHLATFMYRLESVKQLRPEEPTKPKPKQQSKPGKTGGKQLNSKSKQQNTPQKVSKGAPSVKSAPSGAKGEGSPQSSPSPKKPTKKTRSSKGSSQGNA